MPKPEKIVGKKRKEEEEEKESSDESSDSDSEKSSDSSDNSDSSSESENSSSSDSDDSDSKESSDSSEEKEVADKGKSKIPGVMKPNNSSTKGKEKVEEVIPKGKKHKRDDEESSKQLPESKKVKQEENGHTNGHSNGHKSAAKENSKTEVEEWRKSNQLTVVTIEDGSNNTTAPYEDFSDASFPSYVAESVKDFAFKKPTPIQAQSWPLIIEGRDIVGIAETGSGKTLAFGYPAIMNIKNLKKPVKGPKALMLAPTRELAQQIHEVIKKACVPAKLKSCCAFGGVDKRAQANEVKDADIVVATPGRLIDLIQDGSANLTKVTYLVFDEADRMLDMGFIPQIREIMKPIPKERQTLMFSATWPIDVQKFAHTYLKTPIQITIGGEKLTGARKVKQIVEVCARESARRSTIKNLIKRLCTQEDNPRILVFMLYKNTCDHLYDEMIREKWSVEILHGGKNQNIRDKAMDNFRKGVVNILIATDVAARGLDIKDIKYVINGEMPLVMEDYIHRIGRTGRAGESGTAYTIISPEGKEDKVHARQLMRILEEGGHTVPAELAKICETAPTTKPRKSTMELIYGDFAKGIDAEQMMKKPTKITFD